MTQITAPLPLDQTILISRRTDHPGRLRRAITRLGQSVRSADLGGPLDTPSRRSLDATGVPDMTR